MKILLLSLIFFLSVSQKQKGHVVLPGIIPNLSKPPIGPKPATTGDPNYIDTSKSYRSVKRLINITDNIVLPSHGQWTEVWVPFPQLADKINLPFAQYVTISYRFVITNFPNRFCSMVSGVYINGVLDDHFIQASANVQERSHHAKEEVWLQSGINTVDVRYSTWCTFVPIQSGRKLGFGRAFLEITYLQQIC